MTYELPSTNVVCLYSVENAHDQEVTAELKTYFEKAEGYSIDYDPNVSIAKLKHLRPDCSVLFLNTHGIADNNRYEALGSGTHNLNEIGDANLRQELQQDMDHDLIYETSPSGHIAITFELIRQNWRFPKNSFVFINGCMSFNDALQHVSLSAILMNDCHAGVVGGWTQYSTPTADSGITYLFDRLLGTNARRDDPHREVPPQRPFDWVRIFQKMKDLGLDTAPILSEHGEETIPTQMRIEPNGVSDLGLLAPSIEYVEIDEVKKEVTLHGLFGTDQSKIRVFVRECQDGYVSEGDCELILDTSTNEQTIVCKGLPDSGTGSAGYIVVAADYENGKFVQSNAVPITAWKGKFTYTLRLPGQDPAGSGFGQITADVLLRGDIHRSRKKPGEATQSRFSAFKNVKDPGTPAKFTSGGSYTGGDNGLTYEWHGSGTVALDNKAPGGRIGIAGWHRHSIDPAHLKLIVLMTTGEGEALLDVTDKDGKKIITDMMSPINSLYLAEEKAVDVPNDFLQKSVTWAEADGKYETCYDIPAKPVTSLIVYGPISTKEKIITAELKWELLKAKYAPDEQTPG